MLGHRLFLILGFCFFFGTSIMFSTVATPIWASLVGCPGGGNGTPLQYSCLENPVDGGAWWAAVYGVAQSWTRLKQLSSGLPWWLRW